MKGPGGADRRSAGRRKLLRGGVAFYLHGDEERRMNCAVLDMGSDSAKLRPERHGVLPKRFKLQLHTHETYDCTVVRRSGYFLAVTLTPVTPDR
jgi:hypothetical protein